MSLLMDLHWGRGVEERGLARGTVVNAKVGVGKTRAEEQSGSSTRGTVVNAERVGVDSCLIAVVVGIVWVVVRVVAGVVMPTQTASSILNPLTSPCPERL